MVKEEIKELIAARRARIGVIGLGYVGLPLVVEFGRQGFYGVGFEVDTRKAETINAGRSYIPDVPTEHVKELVDKQLLHATTDFSELAECTAIIICVPTPLRKTKEPDVSYILAAAEQIQKYLRRGQIIILESTTYPGTTNEVLLPMFEEKGFALDKDFLLAFSPERVDPGNPQFQTHNIPKVVGGCTEDSAAVAGLLYQQIVNHVHMVSSAQVAEAAKLLENTFRAVNIGMANEMARLCYTLGIDTWEVIRAAATKPFGFMAFYPGPGIGGHCLVGEETVTVRALTDKIEKTISLAELFATVSAAEFAQKSLVDGAEVVYHPHLEALSLNPQTHAAEWKPVSHLFRRFYHGSLVTVTATGGRQLTVTDEHPMLVSDNGQEVCQVLAKNLAVGDKLPLRLTVNASAGSGLAVKLQPETTAQVESIEITPTSAPVAVYSMEVEENHTFATSYGIYVHNCIPLDPHYLSWKARQHGFDSRFISLAEEVNSRMPQHVVQLVADGLNDDSKPLKGSQVLLLGVAYKKDIDDMRESPALSIIDLLRKKGAEVRYHDPFVPEVEFDDAHTVGGGAPLSNVPLTTEEVTAADCVIIVADHSNVDYTMVTQQAKLIVDTRNALTPALREHSQARIVRL